ncbi:MAG: hypothetical protein GF344_13035 [Chitinivibrionales bacterium]|nr:hypothetical protein [Chitinivibrionales bacterium]MBD3357659.1 hypothetical protein [Chitinivibrionales bacterium]
MLTSMITIRRLLAPLTVAGLILAVGCEQMGQQQQRNGGTSPNGRTNGMGNGDGMMQDDTADTGGMRRNNDTARDTGNGWMNGDTGKMNSDTGRGGMNGDTGMNQMNSDTGRRNGGMQMNGMGDKVTGMVAEINPRDSTVVIVDTVKIKMDTEITKNGSRISMDRLNEGDQISVQYETRNGEKVATEITGKPDTASQDRRQMR